MYRGMREQRFQVWLVALGNGIVVCLGNGNRGSRKG